MMKLPHFDPCATEKSVLGCKRTCRKMRAFPFGACPVKRCLGRVSGTRGVPLSASKVLALSDMQGLNLGGTAVCFGISSHVVWGRGVIFLPFPTKTSIK